MSRARRSRVPSPWRPNRYTHVGILVRHEGRLLVLEAVEPVRLSTLAHFAAAGAGGRCVIRRLKNRDAVLTPPVLARLRAMGLAMRGRHYDTWFGWSDERLYCSELVWKLYKRAAGFELARLRRLGDFDLQDPFVRRVLTQRYGSVVPLDEPVVSPGDIFDNPGLETVFTR